MPFSFTGHFLVVEADRQHSGTITPQGKLTLRRAGSKVQIQRGLKKDSVHTRFVLGAHPIIEQFIEIARIREIISTYMASDKRMKLDDDKVLTLLIHNILTTPHPLYEMEDG